jgi:hypothetical protein
MCSYGARPTRTRPCGVRPASRHPYRWAPASPDLDGGRQGRGSRARAWPTPLTDVRRRRRCDLKAIDRDVATGGRGPYGPAARRAGPPRAGHEEQPLGCRARPRTVQRRTEARTSNPQPGIRPGDPHADMATSVPTTRNKRSIEVALVCPGKSRLRYVTTRRAGALDPFTHLPRSARSDTRDSR